MAKFTQRQWFTLIAISSANFCKALCGSLLAPFYPALAERHNCTATEYGLVFGILGFVVFIVSPLYGKLLNKIGAKFTFNGGIYTTGICAILFGYLDRVEGQYPFIILSLSIRIVEGIGNAAFLTASFAIIAKEFPDNVATTFAFLETFFGLGLIVGPTVGGSLFQVGGYTLPFVVMGSALFGSAIIATLVLPKHENGRNMENGPSVFKILAVPGIAIASASIIVTSTSIGFLQATLEPHFRIFQMNPINLGMMFVINGGVCTMMAPGWGWICDHLCAPKIVTIIGTVLVAAGFCLIGPAPFIPLPTILWMSKAGLILHGVGMSAQLVASFRDALKTICVQEFPNYLERYALIYGIWTSLFALGAFIGPLMGGILYDIIGLKNASMFIVGMHILVGLVTLKLFLKPKQPPIDYAKFKNEKLPNGDLQIPHSQTHPTENTISIYSIGNGICIEKSKPQAMNIHIVCNSYKAQAWPDTDSLNLHI